MGFYGNITNTSNTTFSFDRIYPNRLAMDTNANNDGIFIGRYVLVEYEQSAAYPNIYINNGKYYSSPNFEEVTRIKYKSGGRPASDTSNDVFYLGEFGQKQEAEKIYFYMCDGYEIVEENLYATFKQVTAVNKDDATSYLINHNIDYEEYKNAKGYDSSVWTKVNEEKNGKLVTRYRNIADLNSVVPTFDLETDAPTMTPITPHFDADSTNVYYKLHTQPQWGLRVAAQEDENSDSTTTWQFTTYNPATDETITHEEKNKAAAINFNGPAFDAQVGKANILKHNNGENYITILPTGESGKKYYTHTNKNGEKVYEKAPDIQEMRINLPAIGNMMSDAWDIIHGKQRNNYRGDGENASLQGRLDSFEGIKENQIPVKRNDGTLIGTKINNGINYEHIGEILEKPVLDTDILENDDPWIRININTDGLVGGTQIGENPDQSNNNGILIQHTFHSTENSKTTIDKNTGISTQDEKYKEDFTKVKNTDSGTNDNLKLYTPYVDQTGHVVGYNEETIILPYGYKTFTTEGLAPLDNKGKEIVEDLYTTINNQANGSNISSSSASASRSVADNTQDSIAIEPYNKWIQTQLTNDKLVVAHEVHAINTEKDTTNLNNLKDNKIQNEINIPDWDYDEAGHIKKKGEHIYTLPYSYKSIITTNNETGTTEALTSTTDLIAENTQDTLNLLASNKWIKLSTSTENGGKNIFFGHLTNGNSFGGTYHHDTLKNNTVSKRQEPLFGQDFQLAAVTYDNAGHAVHFSSDKVKIPEGKYEIDTPNTDANSLLVQLALDGPTGEITSKSATTNTLKLANYSYIGNVNDTQKITSGQTINNAFSLLEKRINDLDYVEQGSNTQFISKITQSEGIISVERANAGTLVLTGYTQGTNKDDISSVDSINSAFAKLQNQITYEENRINTILTGENDLTGTLDTFIELQSYINEHGQEAADMAKAIENEIARAKEAEEANQQAISDEAIRADLAEKALGTRIDNLDYEKTKVNNYYISSIKQTNGLIEVGTTLLPIRTVTSGTTNGTILVNGSAINVGGLKSAAYTDSSDYARADVLDTEFTYGDDKKTIQDLMNIVKTQADIIVDLTARIEALEPETETPVEGE